MEAKAVRTSWWFQTMGEDGPGGTAMRQARLVSGPKVMGKEAWGLVPERLGPRNSGQAGTGVREGFGSAAFPGRDEENARVRIRRGRGNGRSPGGVEHPGWGTGRDGPGVVAVEVGIGDGMTGKVVAAAGRDINPGARRGLG